MNLSSLSFDASSTSADLVITVTLDNETLYEGPANGTVASEFNDDVEGVRKLAITLSNKTDAHTEIDADGNIVSDHVVEITNFNLDGIELDYVFYSNCVYTHSFNDPNVAPQTHDFFSTMGCNGTVAFEFDSPTYIWLLEKM